LSLAAHVTLSNEKLPRDQAGKEIITGEACVLQHESAYYFYFNDWGSCPGVDCCDSKDGCWSCCFTHPPHPYAPGCANHANGSDPYGQYHIIRAYRTQDFKVFEDLGVVLDLEHRPPGIVFRPHVVFNALTKKFVMYFEDRSSHNGNYLVATASKPEGPFETLGPVHMLGKGRIGDFEVFVDDDGVAYHVRTGFDVVKLNASYTGAEEHMSSFHTPEAAEAPVMFKRQGRYYVLTGHGCCACIGGANLYVHMSESLRGPWKYLGDIGRNPFVPFDVHKPINYVTKSQGSTHLKIKTTSGEDLYIWLGNQWASGLSKNPPGPRNHDLLYWAALTFEEDGSIRQLEYASELSFDMEPLMQGTITM